MNLTSVVLRALPGRTVTGQSAPLSVLGGGLAGPRAPVPLGARSWWSSAGRRQVTCHQRSNRRGSSLTHAWSPAPSLVVHRRVSQRHHKIHAAVLNAASTMSKWPTPGKGARLAQPSTDHTCTTRHDRIRNSSVVINTRIRRELRLNYLSLRNYRRFAISSPK